MFNAQTGKGLAFQKGKEMFFSFFLTLFTFTILIFNSSSIIFAANKKPLILATGHEKGVYFDVGNEIARAAQEIGLAINVIPSQGSRENLLWVSKGQAQLCIAQADTVYNAFNGLQPFQYKINNIQAIASLYTEAVHILVRRTLYISHIENFRGKRISIGPEGSGTEANARALIEAAGIALNEIQLFHLDSDETIQKMRQGLIDIAFFTSGYPNDAVITLTENNDVYLFTLESDLLERIFTLSPFFVATTIPAGTYDHQTDSISTLGVPALLITQSDLDPGLGYKLAATVFTNKSISRGRIAKGIPILLHQGANHFFKEKGLLGWKALDIAWITILVVSLMFFFIFKFNNIVFYFKKRVIARVIFLITIIWLTGSALLYITEHRVNDSYVIPWRAIWSTLINWLNFGSKEPITMTGRVVSVLMIILGAGCIAWLTAEVASIFVAKKLGGKLMTRHIRNHCIILNWNSKVQGIIEQLRDPELDQEAIFIVTKQKDPPPCIASFNSIYHFYDCNIGESILKQVRIDEAKTIMIMADENQIRDTADAETILILLEIRKMLTGNRKHPKIIVEIIQSQRVDLAKYAGILDDGNVEIVSSTYLMKNLFAQLAVTPGLTRVYDDLLTFGSNTNEIYGFELSKAFNGIKFKEIAMSALELRDKKLHIIPIAICRNQKTYINPTSDEIEELKEKDFLYAICDNRKSLNKSLKIIAKNLTYKTS